MRVVFVSTYPPIECGIATYTNFLRKSMAKNTSSETHVVSQYGAEGRHVYPAYSTTDSGMARKIFNSIIKVTPDIVHIQHEFGLFGGMHGIAVLELIYRLKVSAVPVVATLHTVSSQPGFEERIILKTMCRELSGIIVHEQKHKEILISDLYKTLPEKITLIPHGARVMEPISDAKKSLNFENKKVVLLAGYFRPSKRFDRIVDIFPRIVEKVPQAQLVMSSKLRLTEYSEYRETLFSKINNSPVTNNMEVLRGQFPQKTFDTILSASDIMVLPYEAGAQSGVMAHAMTFGKPLVTSKLPAFVDTIEKSSAGFCAGTDNEYIEYITKLLTDKDVYNEKSQNALKYVKKIISWDIVAKQTVEAYEKFDVKLKCKTRYVYAGE